MKLLSTILDWIATAGTALRDAAHAAQPIEPLTPATIPSIKEVPMTDSAPTIDAALQKRYDTMSALILRNRGAFGPSPTTGGLIHLVPDAQVPAIAKLIVNVADAGLSGDAALIAAWIRGESRFDPTAMNPNHQDAKPGETAAQALLHLDVGIGQFDGTELLDMLPGLTIEQAIAKAQDPTWAIPQMAKQIEGLLEWGAAADSQLRDAGVAPSYGADFHVLSFESYNVGKTGALGRVLKDPKAAAKFVLKAGGGALIAIADATAADRAFHAKIMAEITDTKYGYGTALFTRWNQYIVELGQTG